MNRSRFAFGILLIVAGGLLAMDALQWWDAGDVLARWWRSIAELIWPLILIGIGLALIVRRASPHFPRGEDVLELTAVFSGRRAVCPPEPFHGAVALAAFGGVDIDLRAAVLGPEGAFVDATAAFGGVKLIVPPHWRVTMSGPAIFGGNDNKTAPLGPLPPTAPVLHVRALSLFGGVEVQAQPSPAHNTPDVPVSV